MTILHSKTYRDDLGIDTVSRGILYAAHLLAVVSPSNIKMSMVESIDTDTQALKGVITVEATIYYDKETFLESGSNLLTNIVLLSEVLPNPYYSPLSASTSGIPIPNDAYIDDTLEGYFVWLVSEYKKANLTSDPINLTSVKVKQGETTDTFYKKYTIELPYNPLVYFESSNLIQAVDS